jgi:hypothetical protein
MHECLPFTTVGSKLMFGAKPGQVVAQLCLLHSETCTSWRNLLGGGEYFRAFQNFGWGYRTVFPAKENGTSSYSNGSEVEGFDILISGSDVSVANYDNFCSYSDHSVAVSQVQQWIAGKMSQVHPAQPCLYHPHIF